MSKVVSIVVDASGSMIEDDKNAVVKYLLNGICNIKELADFGKVDFILYQWGSTSKKFENLESAKIEFTGKASVLGLDELAQIVDENQPLIFISDGNFDHKAKDNIKKLSICIVPIFIGVDANRGMLQNIAKDKIVYSVTDFMQAIYEVCMKL